MPAHGDQHRASAVTANPFEEKSLRISEYTAQELATLQSRLDKQLGPEYISTRPGAGGGKVHYLAAEKVINLANEVFGFNGWSSQIRNVQPDFVDEVQGKISLGMSITVRVTLKDGTYHEDIGYGSIDNCRTKAAAFEKAKKEAATDALKRALRNFGNILGNCLYDKDYLSKVSKLKVAPARWDADRLHRHPDFAPIKKDVGAVPEEAQPAPPSVRANTNETKDLIDDEFGDNIFDGVDMPNEEARPDEVVLYENQPAKSGDLNVSTSESRSRPPPPQARPMNPPQQPPAPQPRQPAKPTNNTSTPPSISNPRDQPTNGTRPHEPPVGFYTGKAAELLLAQENGNASLDISLPKFKPDHESPSIRRSEGFDHRKSGPILRTSIEGVASSPPTRANEPRAAPITRQASSSNFVHPSSEAGRRIGMPSAQSPYSNRSAYKPPGPASATGGTAAGVKRDFNTHASDNNAGPNMNGNRNAAPMAAPNRQALADVSNTANQAQSEPSVAVKAENSAAEDTKRARVT